MLISEIFHSLQGEGELTGTPAVFVRTSGCNLRCRWCDTPYASWHPEGERLAPAEVLERVACFPSRHCVLTGGEPMIAKGIHELAAGLKAQGRHITIETAATVPPGGIACDLASLSPKLASSAPDRPRDEAWWRKHEALRRQPAVIREWIDHYPYQLKFVFTSPADITEVEDLLEAVGRAVPREKVLLMPEGISAEASRARGIELAEICKARGYRYCHRLHLDLFGHTRGT